METDAKFFIGEAQVAMREGIDDPGAAQAYAQISIAISLHIVAESLGVERVEALRVGCERALRILRGSDREHALVDLDRSNFNFTISDLLREALGMKPEPLIDLDSETTRKSGDNS